MYIPPVNTISEKVPQVNGHPIKNLELRYSRQFWKTRIKWVLHLFKFAVRTKNDWDTLEQDFVLLKNLDSMKL